MLAQLRLRDCPSLSFSFARQLVYGTQNTSYMIYPQEKLIFA